MLAMTAARLKYLALIQSVVSRMAANQFTTRKWSVALGTALIGWTLTKNVDAKHALLAALPAFCFWIQDAFYLSHEWCFRKIFDQECGKSADPTSFCLECGWKYSDWLVAVFAPAVWLVHLPVIVAAVVAGYRLWPF
jgi:hypothetical protein